MAGKKLTNAEIQERVLRCVALRFHYKDEGRDRPIKHQEWLAYCKETYGDKSERTYTDYWMKAGAKQEEAVMSILKGREVESINELFDLAFQLNPEGMDKKLKFEANKELMKMLGRYQEKHNIEIQGSIDLRPTIKGMDVEDNASKDDDIEDGDSWM